MAFHEEIKKYREEVLGISQEEATKRLHITQATLSNYEQGKRHITVESLQQFQKAYSIPPEHLMYMLFGEEAGKPYDPNWLQEYSQSMELERVIEMIKKNEKLMKFLVSLSYSTEKVQSDIAELLPHLLKFADSRS